MGIASIVVRVSITRQEWERLQALAVRRNQASSQLVGALLRDFVQLHDPPPVSGERGEK